MYKQKATYISIMVIVCKDKYDNDEMNHHFAKYPYPLSDFQKYAIDAIVNDNHVLVTAHTGSGKTLPAEFAIDFFCGKGKRVIYTSPIKALSNEKYHDFTKKFPDYSIGILTGDIKFNPNADLLIMTTEILQNHLYKRFQEKKTNNALSFDMDIDNDLACVIFDEIHYINDADRGKVWEETILMLPPKISMVMLSATIDRPEKFASWCEKRDASASKKVILAGTDHRVVPLKHYIYMNSTEHLFKILKDKQKEKEIKSFIGKPQLIKSGTKVNEDIITDCNKLLTLMNLKNCYTKPAFILNSLIEYLYKNEMLPGICFVFSRANVEKYAHQITVNLFGYDDAHVPSIIPDECDKIIRRLPNYNEYKELNEYKDLVALMSKGVAIHHSGMMPILREMVEIIFGRGYLKVLFATETFAVGINMPTKTVVFTALSKYTSRGHRHLLSHEYTQMAGRAGRRGLDTLGHVIHCNNLFRESYSLIDYKKILSGKPQVLQSKFKITYNLLLNLISLQKTDFETHVNSSMFTDELIHVQNSCNEQMINVSKQLASTESGISASKMNMLLITEYNDIKYGMSKLNGKKYKQASHKLQTIEDNYGRNFQRDVSLIKKKDDLITEIDALKSQFTNSQEFVKTNINIVLDILVSNGLINKIDDVYTLTVKGNIASYVHECNSLVMAEMVYGNVFDDISVAELVSFLSCFTNISVGDDLKTLRPSCLKELFGKYFEHVDHYIDIENYHKIQIGDDDEMHYDIMEECKLWCDAENESECVLITDKLTEKGIFIGEFVKAILKINNIANELITASEYMGNIKLSEKLSKVADVTLKYVVLQQSLYL